jgi:hypothetical protein
MGDKIAEAQHEGAVTIEFSEAASSSVPLAQDPYVGSEEFAVSCSSLKICTRG